MAWREERAELDQAAEKAAAGKGEAAAAPPEEAASAPSAPAPGDGAAAVDAAALEERIIAALSTVFDPEIPVNIYELGLIYNIGIDPAANVAVDMTLTSPACPVAESRPGEVEGAVRGVSGVGEVKVELVWDPPWTPDRMSEAARLELGMM